MSENEDCGIPDKVWNPNYTVAKWFFESFTSAYTDAIHPAWFGKWIAVSINKFHDICEIVKLRSHKFHWLFCHAIGEIKLDLVRSGLPFCLNETWYRFIYLPKLTCWKEFPFSLLLQVICLYSFLFSNCFSFLSAMGNACWWKSVNEGWEIIRSNCYAL